MDYWMNGLRYVDAGEAFELVPWGGFLAAGPRNISEVSGDPLTPTLLVSNEAH